MTPSDSCSGVDGDLYISTRPSGSEITMSVNVPPMSTLTRSTARPPKCFSDALFADHARRLSENPTCSYYLEKLAF